MSYCYPSSQEDSNGSVEEGHAGVGGAGKHLGHIIRPRRTGNCPTRDEDGKEERQEKRRCKESPEEIAGEKADGIEL
jgi:hypothetical protein